MSGRLLRARLDLLQFLLDLRHSLEAGVQLLDLGERFLCSLHVILVEQRDDSQVEPGLPVPRIDLQELRNCWIASSGLPRR